MIITIIVRQATDIPGCCLFKLRRGPKSYSRRNMSGIQYTHLYPFFNDRRTIPSEFKSAADYSMWATN
jgi:hypothetical protein